MFRPHGVIFRLIKYGIIQGTSVVATYGILWFTVRLYDTIFYKPEDDPMGSKHVALLIIA